MRKLILLKCDIVELTCLYKSQSFLWFFRYFYILSKNRRLWFLNFMLPQSGAANNISWMPSSKLGRAILFVYLPCPNRDCSKWIYTKGIRHGSTQNTCKPRVSAAETLILRFWWPSPKWIPQFYGFDGYLRRGNPNIFDRQGYPPRIPPFYAYSGYFLFFLYIFGVFWDSI